MTEFDFDELDRAVNETMGQPESSEQHSESSDRPTPDSPMANRPSSLATRRRGRFMDMVHPSADMRGRTTTQSGPAHTFTSSVKKVSHTASPVVPDAPVDTANTPEPDKPEYETSSGLVMPTFTERYETIEESSAMDDMTVGAYLDKEDTGQASEIDASESSDHYAPHPAVTPSNLPETEPYHDDFSSDEAEPDAAHADLQEHEAPIEQQEHAKFSEHSTETKDDEFDEIDEIAESLSIAEDRPLTTPFLADAKVEKRPLGQPPVEVMVEDSKSDAAHEVIQPTEAPAGLEADTKEAEVHDELMDLTDSYPAREEDVRPIVPHPEPAALTKTSGTTSHVPAGGSIPQQYKEQTSSTEATNGSIYDTDTYHQPLEPERKKHSYLAWIIWVVVIALVGAVAGVTVYYFRYM